MPVSVGPRGAVSGAILAGGRARRFGGRDKSALIVGGRRILDRQLDVLAHFTDDRMVVGGAPRRDLPPGVVAIEDRIADAGPLAGICAALGQAAAPIVIVLACDLPFVDVPLLEGLLQALRQADADVALPRDAKGWHPLCACYCTRTLPVLEARLLAGERKVVDALAGLRLTELGPDRLASLDPGGWALTNVNTASDYAALTPTECPFDDPRV